MADEYTPTSWVNGVPPYIDAEHLNKIEAELVRLGAQLAAIKAAYLGKSAISNVQVNDTNKVPSSALVYGMNEGISKLNSNLSLSTITPTIMTEYVTLTFGDFKKFGKLVVLGGVFNVIKEIPAMQITHLLALSDKPVAQNAFVAQSDGFSYMYGIVNTQGQCWIYSEKAIPVGRNITFLAVFFIN